MSSGDNTETLRVTGIVSNTFYKKLVALSDAKKVPLSRLVAIAIEHEFERSKPFEYDSSIPTGEYIELAFVSDAGKILDYIKRISGMSLDMLCLMRHDMGINDKETFLLAFRECLMAGQLESYKPRQHLSTSFKYPDDYVFYRIKGATKPEVKKRRIEATKYETYLKLKKEFKDE